MESSLKNLKKYINAYTIKGRNFREKRVITLVLIGQSQIREN